MMCTLSTQEARFLIFKVFGKLPGKQQCTELGKRWFLGDDGLSLLGHPASVLRAQACFQASVFSS